MVDRVPKLVGPLADLRLAVGRQHRAERVGRDRLDQGVDDRQAVFEADAPSGLQNTLVETTDQHDRRPASALPEERHHLDAVAVRVLQVQDDQGRTERLVARLKLVDRLCQRDLVAVLSADLTQEVQHPGSSSRMSRRLEVMGSTIEGLRGRRPTCTRIVAPSACSIARFSATLVYSAARTRWSRRPGRSTASASFRRVGFMVRWMGAASTAWAEDPGRRGTGHREHRPQHHEHRRPAARAARLPASRLLRMLRTLASRRLGRSDARAGGVRHDRHAGTRRGPPGSGSGGAIGHSPWWSHGAAHRRATGDAGRLRRRLRADGSPDRRPEHRARAVAADARSRSA